MTPLSRSHQRNALAILLLLIRTVPVSLEVILYNIFRFLNLNILTPFIRDKIIVKRHVWQNAIPQSMGKWKSLFNPESTDSGGLLTEKGRWQTDRAYWSKTGGFLPEIMQEFRLLIL